MPNLAILCNGRTLCQWQRKALDLVERDYDVFYIIPTNSRPSKRHFAKKPLYYLLNMCSIRNSQTRRVPYEPEGLADHILFFEVQYQGAWAQLPSSALEWLKSNRIDAIVKFDLGLLQVPEDCPPILSWHHGDPRQFRGRPAGFYELLQDQNFVGQVVQRLSNILDGGEVLAFAETPILPHSYRKTLVGAYKLSPHLLPRALDALFAGRAEDIEATGKNYRLPNNATVAKFLVRLWLKAGWRILYGLFWEKRWRVSTLRGRAGLGEGSLVAELESRRGEWSTLTPTRRYAFFADPFFTDRVDEVLVEALRAGDGKGEIVRVSPAGEQRLACDAAGHLSYPATIRACGELIVTPEMTKIGKQRLFRLGSQALESFAELDCGEQFLIDPTFFEFGGRIFLFANRRDEGSGVLRLWVADGMTERFSEHPKSPVRISGRGSRMAGLVRSEAGGVFRYGQDCRRGYGDGILSFEVTELSPEAYSEELIAEASFAGVRGPHTVNMMSDILLFDWYEDRFSLLAGYRRIRAKF